MKKKAKKQKGSKLVSGIFYSCYFLMIVVYLVGMYFFHGWLNDELIRFEASTQPAYRAEEIFQSMFAEPDWESLYETAGIQDTKFEGKDTFLAYMASVAEGKDLTYEETPGSANGYLYRILADDQALGHFTMINRARPNALIPDWQREALVLHTPRNQSVTVQKQDGHMVYVNGQPLDDSYSTEILSTVAENYLPAGTIGIRQVRQQVSGLLMPPQITVADAQGNLRDVRYDEETGIYVEVPAEPAVLPRELKDRVLAAGEAYCTYMVEQNNALLHKYFASGTDAFWSITTADPWPQGATETNIIRPSVSDYVRYTDQLFSARVKMTMVLTFDVFPARECQLDTTFFFENRKGGWKVIAMTDEDITQPTCKVRLTFMHGETAVSTIFCDRDSQHLYAPLITPPAGQILTGWAEKTLAEDGSISLNPIFTPDENGKIIIPQDMVLHPMTLYPLFEEEPAVG